MSRTALDSAMENFYGYSDQENKKNEGNIIKGIFPKTEKVSSKKILNTTGKFKCEVRKIFK